MGALSDFDENQLAHEMAAAATPRERFDVLAKGVSRLGLDIVNYGFFDDVAAERAATDVQFMTTMSDAWMTYYHGDGLAEADAHVRHVRNGRISPYLWGSSDIEGLAGGERRVAEEAKDIGLRTGLFVPMASPLDPFSPVAGLALAGAMDDRDFRAMLAEHGVALLHLAYVFHNASIRNVWMDQAGGRPLSERERTCLRHLADGLRQDAIADKLGIARVTVEMHLRAARQKLGARTLTEAVAKSILFGQLSRSRLEGA